MSSPVNLNGLWAYFCCFVLNVSELWIAEMYFRLPTKNPTHTLILMLWELAEARFNVYQEQKTR